MSKTTLKSFNFMPGKVIANKYEITNKLGGGWEGEVYKAVEISTKIPCAIKLFYPNRNINNKIANFYAKKLFKLSESPVSVKYYTQEFISVKKHKICCIIFEYAEGEVLSTFLSKQVGNRLGILQGLQLLHSLTTGIESIHFLGEYHGDLHQDNIIINRRGLGFKFKLLDMYNWGDSKKLNKNDDICNLIRIFYDSIGGVKQYKKHPKEIKEICLGLKKNLILKKFKTATHLKKHIENISWESNYRI